MPDLILYPSAPGDLANHALDGTRPAATNWEAVSERGDHNGDLNFVRNASSTSATVRDAHAIEEPPEDIFGAIDSVQVECHARYFQNASSAQIKMLVRLGGTNYTGSLGSLTQDWAAYTYSWTTNPRTNKNWTWQDIRDLQAGYESIVASTGAVDTIADITRCRVIVSFRRLQEWGFAEDAESADFNALMDELPKSGLVGLVPDRFNLANTNTSYPATPNGYVFKLDPLLGTHVAIELHMSVTGGATGSVKVEMQKGANKDQLFEFTTTSATADYKSGLAAVTALANCGDCQGEACQINLYCKTSSGAQPVSIHECKVSEGVSATAGDYLI